jgi:hypothetical protein
MGYPVERHRFTRSVSQPSRRDTERRGSTERGRVVAGTLLGRAELAGGPLVVRRIGIGVSDMWAAMARYWETLGWGPRRVYRQEPPGLQGMQ